MPEENVDEPGPDESVSWWVRARRFVTEIFLILVVALVLSALIRAFIGQLFEIPSGSMENTLVTGDRVAVIKFLKFERGDVVVFTDSGGWLPEVGPPPWPQRTLEFVGLLPSSANEHLIKRVVGLPGDTVECCDDKGRLSVNGHSLDETGYLYTSPDGVQSQPARVPFKVVVPKDRIFVMGDHRDRSGDSRCHLADQTGSGPAGENAFIPISSVVGPAVSVVAPFSHWRNLDHPDVFDQVPAPTEPPPDDAVIEPPGVGC